MEDQVYVSLNSEEHRSGRSEILRAQAEILHILKKLSRIERVQREKDIYKINLIKQYRSLLKSIGKFQDKIPEPRIPKILKTKQEEVIEEIHSEIFQESGIDLNAVEKELLDIQKKLKQLNG